VYDVALKLLVTTSSGTTADITQLIPAITWSGDYQQCARTLQFEMLSSPTDNNIPVAACELGSNVIFMQDNTTLFDGYIFARQKATGSSRINITCFDRGIYLKRNEAVYKFTNMTPEAITRRICSDFGIAAGDIAETGVKISRNFVGVSLYKIIQTAYTLAAVATGKKYFARFNGAKLCVIEKKINDQTLILQGGSNLMSASVTESIENMVNQVAIHNNNDALIGMQKNQELIKLYGLLQNYIKQADGEDATAKAKKMLEDNSISQKITVENLGNVANVTGGMVVVREPYTGLYGLFYIDSDTHTWKNSLYLNKLVINFKSIMDEQEAGSLANANGSKTAGSSDTWSYIYKAGG